MRLVGGLDAVVGAFIFGMLAGVALTNGWIV